MTQRTGKSRQNREVFVRQRDAFLRQPLLLNLVNLDVLSSAWYSANSATSKAVLYMQKLVTMKYSHTALSTLKLQNI